MNLYLEQYYEQFHKYLLDFDKDTALHYSLTLLSDGKVSIQELYEHIITPSLNNITIGRDEEDRDIWKEHMMTNIVRSIIECVYPYVAKEKEKFIQQDDRKRVMVLCPEEEYHEIGARMGADFFTMTGYDVFYIGCNTPKGNFIHAYNELKPDIIAVSITNYLNLVSLKKIVRDIKDQINSKVMLLICGSAFIHTKTTAKDFGAHKLVCTYDDILSLRGNDNVTGI